ncbi:MAG: OmpA family protein [Xenococcus sp. (in: cyanobacteria)]
MTNNQDNNDNEIFYVMADEDSGSRVPWWIFLLPLLLFIVGAIAFCSNISDNQATNGSNPGLPDTGNQATNGSNPELSTTNNQAINDSNPELPNTGNQATNGSNPGLPNTGNQATNGSNPELSTTGNQATNGSNPELSTTGNQATNGSSSGLPNTGNQATNGSSPELSDTGNNEIKGSRNEPIEVKDTVYFAYKETKVSPSDIPKLQAFLSKLPDTTGILIIEGHSDSIGPHEYNQDLAQQRAEQVINQLRAMGLDKKTRVKIQSWGETKPTTDNDTEEGRALNRRVVLYFTNNN